MKKILSIMMIICLVSLLVGCAKLVSTEYENVEVNVVDIHHSAMWLQPIRAGKVTTFVTHPAEYEVIVEYNGVSYTIDDEDTYNRYKDKIGQTTVGTLEIHTYDDGTVKHDITELK
jgi:hypothetical protein